MLQFNVTNILTWVNNKFKKNILIYKTNSIPGVTGFLP